MRTQDELHQDKASYVSKAKGCLIGLATGDAMGDLGRSDAYRSRYGIVTTLYPGAKSTDDTEFGLLTARALLDCGGDLTPDAVLAAWKTHIIDQGGIFDRAGKPLYGAVENIKRGVLPPLSGRDNVQNNDDGAAMRVAPIGIVAAGDPVRAAELARIDAEISHYADGIWAAQAVAAAIAVAMVDGSTDDILMAARDYIPTDSWLGRSFDRAMAICDAAESVEDAWEDLHTALWTPVHSMSAEAVPQMFAIFRLTDGDFRKGMFWACNFGRDADSIAAMCGALSGARHGLDVIPARWVEQVRVASGVSLKFVMDEDVIALAEALVELAL
ncbi:ADP-ribosylglycohydrolase family protein [Aggregatilinea lenta]|uniref:ADP-ribosylglycohydrolase family protein n=1 Tax=Aggregatilinea lenta TaxID=913108 RepID=UPI000E5B3FD8|nr:ADP-ribosylglycohydrolase family protein [Aggregatilinea lenta]